MKALIRLFRVLHAFIGEITLSLLLGIAAITTGIGLLGTSAFIIASAALHPSIAYLQLAIVGVRFFGISRGVFRYFERLISHSVNLKIVSGLREDFYRRVEPGAPSNLVTVHSGDILQRVMGDMGTLENFYVRVISPIVVSIVVITGVSLFIGGYARQLGWILAAGMMITGFLQTLLYGLLIKSPIENLEMSKIASSAKMVELLHGLEDLQACNAQKHYFRMLNNEFERSGAIQNQLSLINGVNNGLVLLLLNLMVLILLWYAIPMVFNDNLSGVSLTVIILVAMACFEAVPGLPAAAQNLNASRVAAGRLFELGEANPTGIVGNQVPFSTPSHVQLERVGFTYPGQNNRVLHDISLELSPGRKVALVGESGAGKTSLINLLLDFQRPQQGSLVLNGTDSIFLDPDSVRKEFSVLSQSAYLFNGSVRENLLLAKPGAKVEELISVIDKAGLSGWFSIQPEGLGTWIGERGVKLSGGERQRLAIARMLLQNNPFVLMDEPTSNLDPLSAKKIMEHLFMRFDQKGILLITHDIKFLPAMDEIILLESGRIVQRGSYPSLVRVDGKFKKLYQLENDRLGEQKTM